MEITADTPTRQVLPLLNEEYLKILMEKLPARAMKKSIFEMSCGEFIQTLDDDYWLTFFEEDTIGQAIGHLKTWKEDMAKLDKYLKINDIPESAEEKQAKRNVVFPTFGENILLTVAEFFHCKSLDEAEEVPFSNYLIVQKHKSAQAKFEHQLHKLYQQKSKTQSKRK